MTDQGKVNYEAYRKASGGVSLVSGAPLPEWDMLGGDIRWSWDAGADAVELWLADAPGGERGPAQSPYEDGAELPDVTAQALGIARATLETIGGDRCERDSETTLRILAREALDRIEDL